MAAGFPEGTPLRRASNFTYNHVAPVQFLRTTYKAGPLLALGLACLGRRRRVRAAAARAGRWPRRSLVAALAAVACWPLVRGPRARHAAAVGARSRPPGRPAADHVDAHRRRRRARRRAARASCTRYYDWGGTVDPILPALAEAPVAVRYAVPYADLRAVDLLWTVDALVQQRRALPGQLAPLLDLLGARTVVSGADDDRTRSGAAPAAEAADVLDQLGRPDARWGPARPSRAPPGRSGAARAAAGARAGTAPRRAAARAGGARAARRRWSTARPRALAGLAAFGALPRPGARLRRRPRDGEPRCAAAAARS